MLKRLSYLSFILFILNACEAKPEKTYFGIPEEESKKILLGVLLNTSYQDTKQGTIIDRSIGLEWKKCSQGQVFREKENDCQGSVNGSLLNPWDQYKYGAIPFNYCNLPTNQCNTLPLPQVLKEVYDPGTYSEVYLSCSTDKTAGKAGWRVPTYPELLKLVQGGKATFSQNFPNSVSDAYWSSYSNELDSSGLTARAISFSEDRFGEERIIAKNTKLYLRCVRNL